MKAETEAFGSLLEEKLRPSSRFQGKSMNQLTWVQKQKHPQLQYELLEQQQALVDMIVDYQNSGPHALCKTATDQFKIDFDGFWRHKVLVKDMSGALVALLYAENWFSDTSILRIGDRSLRMKFRNNPMTELILFEDESQPLVSCRLAPTAMTSVEVAEDASLKAMKERETLLGLAWFLFFPIAQEHSVAYAL